ncbi:MAG: Gfo/Idh/MocA family oxidoreductase [Gemmataceae bacterium]
MKLGLIGLKGHQSAVLGGMKQLGGWEIAGISDGDRAAAERFQKREPLAKDAIVFDDWRRLLDHTKLDCVCLCDENGVRGEQLVALAKLGVHVVSEKPLTTTLDDLAKVRAAWAKSAGRLTMLLTMRHEPKYPEARRLVKSGVIGEPVLVTSQKSYQLDARAEWFRSRQRLGGTIPYIGIHPIDLMRWVTGLEYTHAAAFHGQQGHRDVMGETESQASVLLKLSNGGSATARLDYLRPKARPATATTAYTSPAPKASSTCSRRRRRSRS